MVTFFEHVRYPRLSLLASGPPKGLMGEYLQVKFGIFVCTLACFSEAVQVEEVSAACRRVQYDKLRDPLRMASGVCYGIWRAPVTTEECKLFEPYVVGHRLYVSHECFDGLLGDIVLRIAGSPVVVVDNKPTLSHLLVVGARLGVLP